MTFQKVWESFKEGFKEGWTAFWWPFNRVWSWIVTRRGR